MANTQSPLHPYTVSSGAEDAPLQLDWHMGELNSMVNHTELALNQSGNETLLDEIEYPTLTTIVVSSFLLGIVIILTILGNLLVIVTISTTRRLQTPTNYFIFSLSITDLLLGSVVLPFSAINTVYPVWKLGAIFCNIFISNDVMLCTVSILTLFAISLDRYFCVTMPLKYDQKMNKRIVWTVTICIWVFSFVMAYLPIHLGWNTPNVGVVQNLAKPWLCAFELNKPYTLLIALGTYFAPLLVMCGVYLKILSITKHQVREINRLSMPGAVISNGHDGQRRRDHIRQVSDRKATVTLASIVLAFAVCWVPYFVLFTVKPFLGPDFHINMHIDLFTLWLGYTNSMINPFVYGFYNSAYREAFKRILCKQCMANQQKKKYNALTIGGSNHALRNGSGTSENSELATMKKNSTVVTFTSEQGIANS